MQQDPGIAAASATATSPAAAVQYTEPDASEINDVKRRLNCIKAERAFDKNARKEYAFCRRYARGDSSFTTSVNLLGTYIDILVAFLYARDPDVDVLVADSVGPSRKADIELFAKTLEIVVSRLWRQAKMKRQAKRWIRSALTVGIGWLKVGWQERYESDPVMVQRRRDVQDNLARIAAKRREMAEGGPSYQTLEEDEAELQQELRGLEGKIEKLVYRGLFIDFVPAEDIQVALNVQNIVDCDVADHISHRTFMTVTAAKAKYPTVPPSKWGSAQKYRACEPEDLTERTGLNATAAVRADIDEASADAFTSYQQGTTGSEETSFVLVWEMWDQEKNQIFTMSPGIDQFLAKPDVPNITTTRFYPFFPVALNEVDGQRHPQSLVSRSFQIMDDYNRARSGKSAMRARIKPGIIFDARKMSRKEVEKITASTYGENIPLKPTGDASLDDSFAEKPISTVDNSVFDVQDLQRELETLWGIQEALSAGVTVAKTATEAEIQQTGTQARTGAMRDTEESGLAEMAVFTAEISLVKLSRSDVQELAGPEAFWPEGVTVEELDLLVNVEIRAGSTGKPDTTRQREAWAAEAPVLTDTILTVGKLRNSSPLDIAQCLENVAAEYLDRTGDRLDIKRFMPKVGTPQQLVDPATGQVVMGYALPPEAGAAPGVPGAVAPVPGAPVDPAASAAPAELPPQLREDVVA
jgi:hypothetical protein